MPAYSDWGTEPPHLIEQIARSRLLETARKVLGLPASLPESAAIDAAIVEAVAAPGSGIPVVADVAGRDARFPIPNGDQLAQVKALGYVQRFDQILSAWRSELVTGGAGPLVRAVARGAIGNGTADDGVAVQEAHDTAGATGEAELSGGVYRVGGTRSFANGLTIRRGAKLKAAVAAVLTLGPLTAGHHQVFDTTEAAPGAIKFAEGAVSEVKAEWFGWGPSSTGVQNRTAMRWAVLALPASGGRVTIGPHTVTMDANDADGGCRIMRDDVDVRGSGFGRSVILFDTSSNAGIANGVNGDFGHGSAFCVGDPGITRHPDRLAFYDITFQDTNLVDFHGGGHWPSAIDGWFCPNFKLIRCEFIDVKGNAAMTMLGDAANDTVSGSGDYIVEDCIFRGTPGKGIQRDGANMAAMSRLYYRRNRHYGGIGGGFQLGSGLELGASIGELYAEENYFDMQNVGLACIGSFTIMRVGSIRGNTFLNWVSVASAIPLNPDLTTYPIKDLTIENNRFISPFAGLGGVGISAGVITNLIVRGNYFECGESIVFGKIPAGLTRITKNESVFGAFGSFFVTSSGNPPFQNSTDVLEISHNTVRGGTTLKIVPFSTWTNLKDTRVRGLHTNTLQNPITQQADGQTFSSVFFGGVGAGAVSAVTTVTVVGAMIGDHVRVRAISTNPMPAAFAFDIQGVVSAADTVKWWFTNIAGGAWGGGNLDVAITVERN